MFLMNFTRGKMLVKQIYILNLLKAYQKILIKEEEQQSLDVPHDFTVYYQNIHSIFGCLAEFRLRVKPISEYDIITLTETWLNEDIPSSKLRLDNYNVIRCDGSIFTSRKSTRGGVLLAIKNCFNYSIIPIIDNSL